MAVDDADVGEVELLEEQARRPVGLDRGLDLGAEPLERAPEAERKVGQPLLGLRAGLVPARVQPHAVEVAGDRADVGRDRHAVVVEHDHDRRLQPAGVVQRLVGDAAGERAVADHRDDLAVLADALPHGLLEADRVADRGGGVAGAHDVVLGLEHRAERRQPLVLADAAEVGATPGQDLVRIGLVADVPEDLVPGRVEHAVQRHRQLAGAEVGAEVAADLADRVDDQLAHLLGQALELLVGEIVEVVGPVDRVQQFGRALGFQLVVMSSGDVVQVCRVWMKSVIRARSSVRVSASDSASRALPCDSEASSRARSRPNALT